MFYTRVCGKCGKIITIPDSTYIYKIKKNCKVIYYCSYTCWRKAGGGFVKR